MLEVETQRFGDDYVCRRKRPIRIGRNSARSNSIRTEIRSIETAEVEDLPTNLFGVTGIYKADVEAVVVIRSKIERAAETVQGSVVRIAAEIDGAQNLVFSNGWYRV